GQEAVGDGPAERSLLGPLDVDVDPLVVVGRVGELADLLLRDGQPVTGAELLPLGRQHIFLAAENAHWSSSHFRELAGSRALRCTVGAVRPSRRPTAPTSPGPGTGGPDAPRSCRCRRAAAGALRPPAPPGRSSRSEEHTS